MKAKPLVSILVPVYNVSNYLRECLDSLIAQTLKNIEIICVNDGSTDNSLDILQEYAHLDKRIKIVSKQNGGLPSARNAGLDTASGRYVGFVDADDVVLPNMFEKLYKSAKHHNADVVVCGAKVFPAEADNEWYKYALSPKACACKGKGILPLFTVDGIKPFLWRNLVKRELIERNNLRLNEQIVLGEDQAFQFKLFSVARKVYVIADKLYLYRCNRADSIMNTGVSKRTDVRVRKHILMLEDVCNTLKKFTCTETGWVKFFQWAVDFIYCDIIKLCAKERASLAEEFCKVLVSAGYYNYLKYVHYDCRKHFEYIYSQRSNKQDYPAISYVCVLNNDEFVFDSIHSILSQPRQDIQLILFSNGCSVATHNVAQDYLFKDARVSLVDEPVQPLANNFNTALSLSKAKYIQFLRLPDIIQDKDYSTNVIDILDNNPNVDLVGYKQNEFGIANVNSCQNAKYYNFVYRVDKIKQYNVTFDDYAILTGRVFFTKYCLHSQTVQFIEHKIFNAMPFAKNILTVKDTLKVLKAFSTLLSYARDNSLDDLAKTILEKINSANYIQLIAEATGVVNVKNKGQKSKIVECYLNVLEELTKLLNIANTFSSMAKLSGGMRLLNAFVQEKDTFLKKI